MPQRRCIYHVPYPLDPRTGFGGQVRANKMFKALSDWGEVWLVAGDARQRRRQMAAVRRAVRQGVHMDFCYSESSTMPTAMTEPHHIPTHPIQDFAFLAELRHHRIPVGLFYRDIYWKFPTYGQGVPAPKRWAAQVMYRYDLLAYRKALDVLFLPSQQMGRLVNVGSVKKVPLPPGHDIDGPAPEAPSHPLSLFYVGALSDIYRIHELVAAVTSLPQVKLTVCTRPDGWAAVREEYEPLMGPNVEVVHANGSKELAPYFEAANIAVMALEPNEYRDFAAPLKFFEYIGNGKPILATSGCLTGDIVSRDHIGWTVKYDKDTLRDTLARLDADPAEVSRVRETVLSMRGQHTWAARVNQLAEVLAEVDRRPRRG